ncbi:uncharacterized protein BX663DRAFT_471764 [Cokeromyces recurvatus]|uniref:uncharacterized protein n=1 Tax=Cokeromyces recurvatus TaxID=90255 RepID=UPI00221FE1B4|nr:uncharacterized protein BX663DRAFT_471764 [Cokeromyces recurvatus]KAI7903735.1 hypothetical protein BX663DRAFT_471764 [Cokeromyces recurvatus]
MNILLQKYQNNVLTKPTRTFSIQSSIMMTVGDVISQQLIEKKGINHHDIPRTLRMTVYGAVIGGPVIGTWFGFMNRIVKLDNKWAATIVRVGIDQLFFAPTILAVFMGSISILEGRTRQEIKEKFEKSYLTGLINSYRYWPFVNMFTFAFFPVYYRPIVNNGFGLIWNSYLSYLNQTSLSLSDSDIVKRNSE